MCLHRLGEYNFAFGKVRLGCFSNPPYIITVCSPCLGGGGSDPHGLTIWTGKFSECNRYCFSYILLVSGTYQLFDPGVCRYALLTLMLMSFTHSTNEMVLDQVRLYKTWHMSCLEKG